MVDELFVKVVAAEVGVAVDAEHFKHAVPNVQHGHVECAAAEVEDEDLFVLVLPKSISQRGGGRLRQHAQHLQPGDLAGILRGFALCIVEVGRDGDDRLIHLLTEIHFRCLL